MEERGQEGSGTIGLEGPEKAVQKDGKRQLGAQEGEEGLSWLSLRLLVSAQVMISWSVSSSPALGSRLTVQSLFGILSFSLSPCPSPALALSKINKQTNKLKNDCL